MVVKTVIGTWKAFRDARRTERMSVEEYFAKLTKKGLNRDGSQILSPIPMAPPIGYKKHPSMVEIVRDMVRGERLAAEAAAAGNETFEESEDFDVGEDEAGEMMRSPWENQFDPPLEELLKAGREALANKPPAAAVVPAAEKPAKSGGAGGTPPAKAAPAALSEEP